MVLYGCSTERGRCRRTGAQEDCIEEVIPFHPRPVGLGSREDPAKVEGRLFAGFKGSCVSKVRQPDDGLRQSQAVWKGRVRTKVLIWGGQLGFVLALVFFFFLVLFLKKKKRREKRAPLKAQPDSTSVCARICTLTCLWSRKPKH